MPQQDMAWDTFVQIIDRIPKGSTVMLQGEGEPTMWPHWWQGVELVRSRGLTPYSIINGSRIDVFRTALLFPRIGVSIDTLNAKESEQIGRHNLKKVLENVEQLARAMPNRVTIHIVRAQTGIEDVIRWAIDRELNYCVQPLQHKEDYEVVYPMWMRARPGPAEQAADRYECKYLSGGSTHFYDVEGRDLPCCYIKRNADTFDRDAARQQMQSGVVPSHCTGCRQLTKVNNGNQASTNGSPHQNA